MQTHEIAETLRSAAALPMDEALRAVIRLAMTAEDWTAGSITSVAPTGSMRTVAHVGAWAIECDRLQFTSGQGPAYEVAHGASRQFAGDLREDGRWGSWPTRAVAVGILSTLSVRLYTVGTLGTLNLYSARKRETDGGAFECAEMVAAFASVFLAHFNAEQQFLQAIEVGTAIGQAQGILMQRYRLSPGMALALLRNISELSHVEVAALAAHLVATGELKYKQAGI